MRPVCTWLSVQDCEKFYALAKGNGVTVAAYLRAVIVDVIEDETERKSALDSQPIAT